MRHGHEKSIIDFKKMTHKILPQSLKPIYLALQIPEFLQRPP
jgi:hypothetical protein